MKLYVWEEPYGVNYGTSLCFAMAGSEEDARRILKLKGIEVRRVHPHHYCTIPDDMPPTHVHELPAGEWHHWEE